jgi:hypothetical protein
MSDHGPLAGPTQATFNAAYLSPAVYAELIERQAQNAKWGEQNHPDGTGPDRRPLAALDTESATAVAVPEHMTAATLADVFRRRCQTRFLFRVGTWADILLEELMEALAESDPRRLHTELVQVAAVATQWADAIQRRGDLT